MIFLFYLAFCCCCFFSPFCWVVGCSFFSATGAVKLAVLTKQQYFEWYSLKGAIFCSSLNALIASLARDLKYIQFIISYTLTFNFSDTTDGVR